MDSNQYKNKLLEVVRKEGYDEEAKELEQILELNDCSGCLNRIDGDLTKEILGPRIGKCYNYIMAVIQENNKGNDINNELERLENKYSCHAWNQIKEKYSK